MKDIEKILEKYKSFKKEDIQSGVKDKTLSTKALIEYAKHIIIAERNDDDDHNHIALTILHHRASKELLIESQKLLESDDSIERELGCRILREFPNLNSAPTVFSEEIIHSISRLIRTEHDIDVLLSGLNTIAWQRHLEGHKILQNMSSDSRDYVRFNIANHLLMIYGDLRKLSKKDAEIFLKLAKDDDEDIKSCVFYEIADYPEIFSEYKAEFIYEAQKSSIDSNSELKKEGLRAIKALNEI